MLSAETRVLSENRIVGSWQSAVGSRQLGVLSEESKISWQLEVGCQHFLKSWELGLDSWMSFSRVVW